MANPSVETVETSGGRLILSLGVLLVIAGFAGFFWFSSQEWYVRYGVLLAGVVAGVAVGLLSGAGKRFIGFAKDAWREVRKVVWPTRKEAVQTTLIVFGFVLAMAIFLWVCDKIIEWGIFSVVLKWK